VRYAKLQLNVARVAFAVRTKSCASRRHIPTACVHTKTALPRSTATIIVCIISIPADLTTKNASFARKRNTHRLQLQPSPLQRQQLREQFVRYAKLQLNVARVAFAVRTKSCASRRHIPTACVHTKTALPRNIVTTIVCTISIPADWTTKNANFARKRNTHRLQLQRKSVRIYAKARLAMNGMISFRKPARTWRQFTSAIARAVRARQNR